MTAFEIRIDRLVLRDLPAEYLEGLDGAIARAVEAAARGAVAPDATNDRAPLAGRDALARRIGQRVWDSVQEGRP